MSLVPIFDAKGIRVGPRLPMKVGNRYKLFIPCDVIKRARSLRAFHEKVVTITALSKNVAHVFVKTDIAPGSRTPAMFCWADPDWLFTINVMGNCICETRTLTTSGCQCGGN